MIVIPAFMHRWATHLLSVKILRFTGNAHRRQCDSDGILHRGGYVTRYVETTLITSVLSRLFGRECESTPKPITQQCRLCSTDGSVNSTEDIFPVPMR